VVASQVSSVLSRLQGRPDIVTDWASGGAYEHLDFNVGGAAAMPLLHEAWFRRAVAHAIDRQAIVTAVFGSIDPEITPLQSLLYLPPQWQYQPHFAAYGHDLAKATALMTSHGCAEGGDGIYSCGGQPASFALAYTAGNTRRQTEFIRMKEDLAVAGIELTEVALPAGELYGQFMETGAHDTIDFAWATNGDPSFGSDLFACTGMQNYGRYCSQELSDLLAAANREFDHEPARAALANRADALMAVDLPSLPLYAYPSLLAYRTTLDGLVNKTSAQGPFWNAADWRLRRSA
jgi:peptide/nickel transport system substrate-binding protein